MEAGSVPQLGSSGELMPVETALYIKEWKLLSKYLTSCPSSYNVDLQTQSYSVSDGGHWTHNGPHPQLDSPLLGYSYPQLAIATAVGNLAWNCLVRECLGQWERLLGSSWLGLLLHLWPDGGWAEKGGQRMASFMCQVIGWLSAGPILGKPRGSGWRGRWEGDRDGEYM